MNSPGDSPARANRKLGFMLLGGKLIAAVAIVGLMAVFLDLGKVVVALKGAHSSTILVIAAATVLLSLLGGLRWWLLLRAMGYPQSYWSVSGFRMIGQALCAVLPSGVAGDFVQVVYVLDPPRRTYSHALGTVFVDRLFGLGAVIVILAAVVPAVSAGDDFVERLVWQSVLGILAATVIGICAMAAIWLLDARLPRGHGVVRRLIAALRNMIDAIGQYRRTSATIAFVAVLAILCHGLVCATLWAIGPNFGDARFLDVVVAISVSVLASLLPISISGLGVREGIFALVLGAGGMTPESAVALSLTWYAVSLLTMTMLAVAASLLLPDASPMQILSQYRKARAGSA